jgi:hypothetical protein
VVTVLLFSPALQAATFQLPQGTEIKVKFNTLAKISSSDAKPGEALMITLVEPVTIGDQVLIAEGAAGKAVVTEVEEAGAPGKPGRIVVEFVELGTRGGFETADGSAVKLTGKVEKMGKSKKTLAFITIIGIFFIKGGQGEISSEEVYTAEVAETVVLKSE